MRALLSAGLVKFVSVIYFVYALQSSKVVCVNNEVNKLTFVKAEFAYSKVCVLTDRVG